MKTVSFVLNQEVSISRASRTDKCVTLYSNQLDLGTDVVPGSEYELTLAGQVTVRAVANRSNTLRINQEFIPRLIRLPQVGRPTKALVRYVKQLY